MADLAGKKVATLRRMPAESTFRTTGSPFSDARAFLKANDERSEDEIVALLVRVGWGARVAVEAAHRVVRGQ